MRQRDWKRCLDLVVSVPGLVILTPVFVLVGLLVRLDSEGAALFRQERIGRDGKPFIIYKFRTMVVDPGTNGGMLTAGRDQRVTRIGRFLRYTKIDELPQLINVVRGDMSLVGPRPEVRRYVDLFMEDYQEILKVRPGITDLASLKYRDESALLGRAADPEQEYLSRVLPDKIALAKEYVDRSSLGLDISIIFRTALRILTGRSVESSRR